MAPVQSVETILALLGLTTVLAFLAHKAKVPYPIFLVVGGMAVAFVPGLPSVSLDPQLVFLFFLPPILYAAGYFTSWRDFRANIVSISLLAVGLVVATTAAVAAVVVALVPGVPWPAALVLGAIVSPPDAVAATAIARRVRLPRQVVTVLEGESLVNDATGLVLLKFASVAIVTGRLAVLPGIADFAVMVVGGIAVGIALGWLFAQAQRVLDDAILATTASLLFSFVAYVVAEHLHVSGVLATVTAGVVQGRYVPRILSSRTRIESTSVWQTVIFLLNALVFVLIGLQLPRVLEHARLALADGRGRDLRDVRDGGRRAPRLDVPGRLPPALPVSEVPQDAPVPALAGGRRRGMGGDARRRLARGGALAAARARGRTAVSGPEPHHLHYVLGHLRDARRPGALARAARPVAPRGGGPLRRE